MLILHVVIIGLVLVTTAAPDTDCPEVKGCQCLVETDWLTGNRRYIVNCAKSNLKSFPDLKSLSKTTITKLLLNGNNISRIAKEDFCNIEAKELDVSHNPMLTIDNNTFACLRTKLTVLSLENVGLNINNGLAFLKGLRNLRELNLGSNNDFELDSILTRNVFRDLDLYSLKKLNLANCQLSNMNISSFSGLEGLEELMLEYNYFESVPYEIKRLAGLKHLNLYGNEITALTNGSFSTLRRMEKLNLGSNEIYTVDDDAFRGLESNLHQLDINDNELTFVPSKAIRKLRSLTTLNLAMNFIENIEDDAFQGQYRIKELILDGNPINFSAQMFNGMEHSIERLRIRNMRLTSLPLASLKKLKTLKTLDMAQNRIKDIQKGFMQGLHVESLYLSANNISHVSLDGFSDLGHQLDLDMTSNKISNITFILFSKPCAIRNIDVSDNPIVCDCALEQIKTSGVVSSLVEGDCLFHGGEKAGFHSDDVNGMLSTMCQTSNRKYNCLTGTEISSNSRVEPTLFPILVLVLTFICLKFDILT